MPRLKDSVAGVPQSPGVFLSSRLRPKSAGSCRPPPSPEESNVTIDDLELWVEPDWREDAKKIPASLGHWVDGSLSQSDTTIADIGEYSRPPADRVLPRLSRELKNRTPLQQRIHLSEFAARVHALERLEVYRDDATEVFAVLFTLMQRRDGFTPWQTTLHRQISDLAFTVVCNLLCRPHRWRGVCLAALREVTQALHCTPAAWNRVVVHPAKAWAVPEENDSSGEESSESSLSSESSGEVTKLRRVLNEQLLLSAEIMGDDPFLRTLHCVDPALLGSLCEGRFLQYEDWFKRHTIRGHYFSAGLSDELEIMLAEAMQPGFNICGVPLGSSEAIRKFDRDSSGTLSLTEFVLGKHPDVPARFLRRRAKGRPVCDRMTLGEARKREWTRARMERLDDSDEECPLMNLSIDSPDASRSKSLRPGSAPKKGPKSPLNLSMNFGSRMDRKLSSVSQVSGISGDASHTPVPTEALAEVCDAFRALDLDSDGLIAWDVVELNSEMIGMRQLTRKIFDTLEQRGTGKVALLDLCGYFFPKVPQNDLRRVVGQIMDSAARRDAERAKAARESERRWRQEEIIRRQGRMRRVETAEDGCRKSEMGREGREREALVEREAGARVRAMGKADRHRERERLAALRNAAQPAVPLFSGCDPFPIATNIAGLRITRDTIRLDAFVADAAMRPLAEQLLGHLDSTGFCVHYFATGAHSLLRNRITERCRVYRDFTCSAQRPLQPVRWTGWMFLHCKTNLRARSDIMFRFHFEGFNWGNNSCIDSVVVGFAARGRTELDTMQEFGWPAEWDGKTSVCFADGLERVTPYYTSDGFVAFRLAARSLMDCGVTASAWLVFHGHGAGQSLTASWHHQEEDL
eukprot:Hpha_TRINITY_DN16585_c0_g1::TRINITY_DN16585_c0_g1_i1::g.136377::m.136377